MNILFCIGKQVRHGRNRPREYLLLQCLAGLSESGLCQGYIEVDWKFPLFQMNLIYNPDKLLQSLNTITQNMLGIFRTLVFKQFDQ